MSIDAATARHAHSVGVTSSRACASSHPSQAQVTPTEFEPLNVLASIDRQLPRSSAMDRQEENYRAGTSFSTGANLLKKLLLFQRGRCLRLATASTTCIYARLKLAAASKSIGC